MKRFLSFLLVLTLIFCTCSLTACEFFDGLLKMIGVETEEEEDTPKVSKGLEFELSSDKTCYMLAGIGECSDKDIIVPSEYDGKPVTSVLSEAFAENDSIVSIVLPSGVTSIGKRAFYKCKSLEKAVLPEGILSLGDEAFAFCSSLKEMNIPNSLTHIPPMAFMFCTSLESIVLHDEIKSLGENCFAACTSLKKLYVPKGITLSNFTEFYLFLNSLNGFDVSDDNPTFYDVDGSLYISIDDGYSKTTALISYPMGKEDSRFTVPSNVDIIFPAAFNFLPWDVDSMDEIENPDLGSINYHSNLTEVVISEGVSTIMMLSFMFCTDLERVVIPSTVTYIGSGAFTYCLNLETIEYNGTMEQWYSLDKADNWNEGSPVKEIVCSNGTVVLNGVEPGPQKETITMWVSTIEGVKEFTERQIDEFMALHPEYSEKYQIVIERIGDGDAASEIIRDVATAPDIYFFAQDQLSILIQAGALSPLGTDAANSVRENSNAGSLNAVTVGDKIYAYPLSSDNGYFLFYDSRYISDEEAQSIEGIIAACERSGKKFGYNLSNAWTMASFFFAQPVGGGEPLCTSEWYFNNDGRTPIAVNDNFNSTNGLIAMKAMRTLADSSAFYDNSDYFDGTAAMVTGLWNVYAAESEYGDYVKATKLPTFTVDGNTYQLGSYSGHRLIGVKPQQDAEKATFLHDLAAYLTTEEAQLERYYEFQWGPADINAQQNPDVQDNIFISALINQNIYSQPQKPFPSDWWTIAAELGETAMKTPGDSELIAALEQYEQQINELVN